VFAKSTTAKLVKCVNISELTRSARIRIRVMHNSSMRSVYGLRNATKAPSRCTSD